MPLSSIDFDSTELLGVEVRGDSALQTIRVNQSNELAIGNELRVGANGRTHLDAGSLNSRRWLDIKSGGQLTGIGDMAGQLYNWGSIAPGLPTDLPPAVVGDSEGPAPGNFGGAVDPGVAVNSSEPTENVIFDGITGNTIQTVIDSSANPGARGQNFTIGPAGSTAEIGGVTGLAMAPEITILYEETFRLPIFVPINNFLIFGFANPVSVNGGEPLGMMVFSNTEFEQLEGNNNGGGRLLYRAGSAISMAGSRDMRFSFNETGRLSLDGDFFHQPSGEIRLQVGGTDNSDSADYQFDQLLVDGTMTNGGSLVVELLPEYQPQNGDQITLIQSDNMIGEFSSVDIQGAPDGFDAEIEIDNGNVILTLTDEFLLGDTNRDGIVNFLDIAPFISILSAGGFLEQADINGDGQVNFLDISPFIGILSGQSF